METDTDNETPSIDYFSDGYNDFTHQHMVGGVTNFVYTQTKKGGEFSFILQGSLGVFVILAECEIL